MAKFYSTLSRFKRRDRSEIVQTLTSLDVAILQRATDGADYYSILNACKPYKGRNGVKFFATSDRVKSRIKVLKERNLLEIG